MRHIEIMQNARNPLLPKIIATVTGNNFGDQIIEYKSLFTGYAGRKEKYNKKRVTEYVTVAVVRRSEGDWLGSDQAIRTYYHTEVKLKRKGVYPSRTNGNIAAVEL